MTAGPQSSIPHFTTSRHYLLLFLVALGATVALRWPQLDRRPMHNDEAVNAIKFRDLWDQSVYKYDPNEHHGPTLLYATLAVSRLTGAPDFEHFTENRLRLVTVLFGFALVLLLPLVADGLGRTGTAWAALLTATSPALVFYSRYYIHEMLLVFFAYLALAAGWRYWRTRKLGWILLSGVALGLMHATKETFVISLAAAGLALALNQTWNRLLDASGPPVKAPPLKLWHLAAALGVWLAVAILLFSSFLSNAHGPIDSLRTYVPWFNRAGGNSPHIHPWHFYLHRLLFFHVARGPVWTEALILFLAIVGAVAGFRRRLLGGANASFVRFLALYSFLLTAVYSLLAYKTPWCLLNFWQTTILLAGVGGAVLLRLSKNPAWKIGLAAALLVGAGHLAWLAWEANTEYAANRCNPYIYAQTSADLLNLTERVQGLAKLSPEGAQTFVAVLASEGDCWPLPWYLRNLKQVGYWDVPTNVPAPIIILSPKLQPPSGGSQMRFMGYFELRPQVFLELHVRTNLFQEWLIKRPHPKE